MAAVRPGKRRRENGQNGGNCRRANMFAHREKGPENSISSISFFCGVGLSHLFPPEKMHFCCYCCCTSATLSAPHPALFYNNIGRRSTFFYGTRVDKRRFNISPQKVSLLVWRKGKENMVVFTENVSLILWPRGVCAVLRELERKKSAFTASV